MAKRHSSPLFDSLSSSPSIRENGALLTIDLSLLTCVDDYMIEGNGLSEEEKTDLLVQLAAGC